MRRAAARVFAGLFGCIESAKSGISRGGEDYIGALADLRESDLFPFARIVPGGIGDADIVLNHLDVWVRSFCALLESTFETVNQANIHAADETDRIRLRSHSGDQSNEI